MRETRSKYLAREGGKKITTCVQLTPEQHKRLMNISEKERKSMSALVNEALRDHFFSE